MEINLAEAWKEYTNLKKLFSMPRRMQIVPRKIPIRCFPTPSPPTEAGETADLAGSTNADQDYDPKADDCSTPSKPEEANWSPSTKKT